MKKYLWTLLAFVLFIGLSCQEKIFIEKDSTNDLKMELESLNGSSLKNSKGGKGGKPPKTPGLLSVGDKAEGGIIFFVETYTVEEGGIDVVKQSGLVCALSDLTFGKGKNRVNSFPWGCTGTLISGAMGEEIGTGKQNTEDIIKNDCTIEGTAAYLCNDLILNGFGDWFLPNIEELKLMYSELHAKKIGFFTNTQYWSSNQIDENDAEGLFFFYGGLLLSKGFPEGMVSKNNQFRVRPVRKY